MSLGLTVSAIPDSARFEDVAALRRGGVSSTAAGEWTEVEELAYEVASIVPQIGKLSLEQIRY